MGIIRDLIGGAVQQGLNSRGSNQRTDREQYQTYPTDTWQQQPWSRSGNTLHRQCARSQTMDVEQSLNHGYFGGRQIEQRPQDFPPRLPPRQGENTYSSGRVYHSVLLRTDSGPSGKGYPLVGEYKSSQTSGDPPPSLCYSFSEPALPVYQEEDNRLDETEVWSGLPVPVALPQAGFGQGVPFIRAYSDQLEEAGISRRIFLDFLDALNVTVVPNPETQIVNKAAGIAGWFVPGAGGIALGLVQVGSQIGGAMHLKQATANCLQTANRMIFAPAGLEVLICKTQDIDRTVGCPSSFAVNLPAGAGYMDKLQSYGSRVAPLETLPPVRVGRSDLVAQLGTALSSRSQQKTQEKAAKDMASGKMKRTNAMDESFKWLLIRNLPA